MIRVGRGRSAITIDGPIADGLEKELRAILGPLADKLDREAVQIMEEAQEQWPVGDGKQKRSRDAFSTVLTVIPGTFQVEVSIVNTAPHTKYIKSTKVGKRSDKVRIRSPLQAHVAKPARSVRRKLKKELPALLANALNNTLEG